MPVGFSELLLAFEFVSSGGMGENEAYFDRQSGKIYWHSEFGYNDEQLPDEIDDKKYILIPDKRELDLGKPLVLDFARGCCQVNLSRAEKRKAACAITLRLPHSAIRSPLRLEKSATLIARRDGVVR